MVHEGIPPTPTRVYPFVMSEQPRVDLQQALLPMKPSTSLNLMLGPENCVTVCPICRASIKTAVKYTCTTRTHLTAALWALACFCCCIPYCLESAKNSDHYCPNCQSYLGTYKK